MKNIYLLLLTFLISFSAKSQIWQWERGAGNYNELKNGHQFITPSGVAYDKYNNIYSLGAYYDTLRLADTLIVTSTGYKRHVFMVKYNEAGKRIWIRIFNNCNVLSAKNDIYIDSNGDIVFGAVAGIGTLPGQTKQSGFISKIKDDGQVIWTRYITKLRSLTLDKTDNVYASITPSAYDTTVFDTMQIPKRSALCIGKLNKNGSATWLKTYPSGYISRHTLEVNPGQDELMIAAEFSDSINIDGTKLTKGTYQKPGFLARISTADGTKHKVFSLASYSSFFSIEHAKYINNSSIAICGQVNTAIVVNNVNTTITPNYGYHSYIIVVDTLAAVKWTNYVPESYPQAIGVGSNNVYLGGYTTSNGLSSTGYIGRYDLLGNLKFMNYAYKNSIGAEINYVTVTPLEKVLFAGELQNHQMYTTTGDGIFGNDTLRGLGNNTWFVGTMVGNSNVINGRVYLDANNNGLYDLSEREIPNTVIKLQPQNLFTTSDEDGIYAMGIDSGSYSLTPFANFPKYYSINPASYLERFDSSGEDRVRDFRLVPNGSINDLEVDLTPLSAFRPGFKAYYQLTYKNVGTTTLSGTYSLKKDSSLVYFSSDSAATATYGDSLTFSYKNLQPFEERENHLTFIIKSSTPINDSIINTAYIYPIATDTTPTNNISRSAKVVTGSFDPNSKEVFPAGNLALPSVQDGKGLLTYTLNFQNTGNDTAINIKVIDSLPSYLDLTTLQLVTSSHPVELEIKGNRTLEFSFNNIYLVDSFKNEPLSHGFVKFSIKPITTVTTSDTIVNHCNIYFDYNLPIETNTVKTGFSLNTFPVHLITFNATRNNKVADITWRTAMEEKLSRFEVERSSQGVSFKSIGRVHPTNKPTGAVYKFVDNAPLAGINYYRLKTIGQDGKISVSTTRAINFDETADLKITPNPAKNEITYSLGLNRNNATSISIYDLKGRIVLKTTPTSNKINLERLSAGTYIIVIHSQDKKYQALLEKL